MKENIVAKPFLKWAGGKTQLITDIEKVLPYDLIKEDFVYIEPFVGSGAVLFWLINNYPNMKKAVINDINDDLINTYKVIKYRTEDLVSVLRALQEEYHAIDEDVELKKEYYYSKRELYNSRKENDIGRAALFIFLNKTCFNGLYRVNRKGQFNVPIGRYKNPLICDKENLIAAGNYLKHVNIVHGDFELVTQKAKKGDFIYFDPPYQPLNETSYFTSYTENGFTINEQERLCEVYKKLSKRGCYVLLSNSNTKIIRDFYKDFRIIEVSAKRSINSVGNKRGKISELLIKSW